MKKILKMVLLYLVLIGLGLYGGLMIGYLAAEANFSIWLLLGVGVITVIISVLIHILIHELGHLVFGKLSGYDFVSYRVGSHMLQKSKGVYSYKRYQIPGTGGQCLMSPSGLPETYPYAMYNWGGVIFNGFASFIALLIFLSFSSLMVKYVATIFIIMGLFLAIMNSVPMKNGTSDGSNLAAIKANPKAREALWYVLKQNELFVAGETLNTIDKRFVPLFDKQDVKDGLTMNAYVNAVFASARNLTPLQKLAYYDDLVTDDLPYIPVLKGAIDLEYHTQQMLATDTIPTASRELEIILKGMKHTPEVIVYQYLKVKGTEAARTQALATLKRMRKTYPYVGNVTEAEILIQNY